MPSVNREDTDPKQLQISRDIHILISYAEVLLMSTHMFSGRAMQHQSPGSACTTTQSDPTLSSNRIIGYCRIYEWRTKAQMRLCACTGFDYFFIPYHTIVAGYCGVTLAVRVSIRPSIHRTSVHPYFHFQTITWVNVNGFSPNSVCALILWRSGLWLLMGKFYQFLYPAIQKWRGIMVSRWSSVCPSIRPSYVRPSYVRPSIFCFWMITGVNINGFSPNLVCALILWRSGLGLLMGKFCQIFTELSARDTPIFSFLDDN